jgi:choline dehydrogenase-like flavoprotein
MADHEFEFVVVDAGSAGCVLAGRFSEHASVLLIEAGPMDASPNSYVPDQAPLLIGSSVDHGRPDGLRRLGTGRRAGLERTCACSATASAWRSSSRHSGLDGEVAPSPDHALIPQGHTAAIERLQRQDAEPQRDLCRYDRNAFGGKHESAVD